MDHPEIQEIPSRWRFLTKSEWVNVFLTFVIAATGVVGIILVIRSGADTQQMITAAQQQASADRRLATAMENSVSLAQANYIAAVEQAEIAQRAWVSGALTPPGPIKAGQVVDFRIVITNTGRTPALRVRLHTQKELIGLKQSATLDTKRPTFLGADLRSQGQIQPNQSIILDYDTWFSAKDADLINTQKVRIYFAGRIEYEDVFGVEHWTTFCQYFVTGGMFANYSRFNEMDSNQPRVKLPSAH